MIRRTTMCSAAVVALLAAAVPAIAAPRAKPAAKAAPSFDCRRASSDAEKAICRSPALAQIDVAMAQRYAALLRTLAAPAAAALKQDQQAFLSVRDQLYSERSKDYGMYGPRMQGLIAHMQDRLGFLRSIDTTANGDFAGVWKSHDGEIEVKREADGAYSVSVNSVEPVMARWVCNASGRNRATGNRLEISDPEVPEGRLTFVRQGAMLKVTETALKQGLGGSPYCGAGGWVEGQYFKVTGSRK